MQKLPVATTVQVNLPLVIYWHFFLNRRLTFFFLNKLDKIAKSQGLKKDKTISSTLESIQFPSVIESCEVRWS